MVGPENTCRQAVLWVILRPSRSRVRALTMALLTRNLRELQMGKWQETPRQQHEGRNKKRRGPPDRLQCPWLSRSQQEKLGYIFFLLHSTFDILNNSSTSLKNIREPNHDKFANLMYHKKLATSWTTLVSLQEGHSTRHTGFSR